MCDKNCSKNERMPGAKPGTANRLVNKTHALTLRSSRSDLVEILITHFLSLYFAAGINKRLAHFTLGTRMNCWEEGHRMQYPMSK